MNLIELDHALRKLRLSGMASTTDRCRGNRWTSGGSTGARQSRWRRTIR